MSTVVFCLKADNMDDLINLIWVEAMNYCSLTPLDRQKFSLSGTAYLVIKLWDGSRITATSISSYLGQNLDIIDDTVLIDGIDVRTTVEANTRCLVRGIKSGFVTLNDYGDSTDILLWQHSKSS